MNVNIKKLSFTAKDAVSEICNPLTAVFDANLFIYQRSIINREAARVESNAHLCSNADILSFILGLAPKNREPAKYDYDGGRKYILVDATQPQFTSLLSDSFGVHNLLSRDEQVGENEWEHFLIGSATKGAAVVNKYLNNMELLDKFVNYFRDRATTVIDEAKKNSIISGRPLERVNFGDWGKAAEGGAENISLIPEPSHYFLTNQFGETVAVPRSEMRCLVMLAQGRSALEIARAFDLSPRTVEGYIAKAKQRLNCYTKSNLLDILARWKKSNMWSI